VASLLKGPPIAPRGKHMRIVQVLTFVVFSALLFAGGAWALAWWGTPRPPDPIEAGLEARPELKSPGALETAPERRSTGEVKIAPDPVFAALEPAHKAKTKPAKPRCMKVTVNGPFTKSSIEHGVRQLGRGRDETSRRGWPAPSGVITSRQRLAREGIG
jgi:hypothetical protein